MLRLQGGNFDVPDRMFHSIAQTFKNCMQMTSDVKELIPEFFQLPADFLENGEFLDLGTRQDGTRVHDVGLPPWASSPADFVRQHHAPLESDHVSAHLHEWIDLIFGYKQTGAEAAAADNVFYYLTYEGAVDIESIADPLERAALEAQVNEFGQIPLQLFTAAHPALFQVVKKTRTPNLSLRRRTRYPLRYEGKNEPSGGIPYSHIIGRWRVVLRNLFLKCIKRSRHGCKRRFLHSNSSQLFPH